jgi:regulator of protease activity HflC (stomatin/prohibitin superfamily)
LIRIEPGKLGLLLVRGKATDTALLPGPHFVPAFRRRMVQEYPSLELTYRAEEVGGRQVATALERGGPPVRVLLGDRVEVTLSYTVRFRLEPEQLRAIHERFGPDGIWPAVRDQTASAVRAVLEEPQVAIDAFFGPSRHTLETAVGEAVTAAVAGDGYNVTYFGFGDLDLGRSGEVIQAAVRARLELDREQAEVATRIAQARNDADLEPYLTGANTGAAMRYREVEAWRELARVLTDRGVLPPRLARDIEGIAEAVAPPELPADGQ